MRGRRLSSRALAQALIWHQGYGARHMRDVCTVELSLPHMIPAQACEAARQRQQKRSVARALTRGDGGGVWENCAMLCTLKAAYQLVMPWPVSNHHVRTMSADAITDLLTVQSAMACRGPMLCRCARLSGVIIEHGQVGYHGLLPSCLLRLRLSAASGPFLAPWSLIDGRLFWNRLL